MVFRLFGLQYLSLRSVIWSYTSEWEWMWLRLPACCMGAGGRGLVLSAVKGLENRLDVGGWNIGKDRFVARGDD